MAKTKLKRMDRFELLELMYNMRKANLELTERLEAAEKKIEELKTEADQRVEAVRAEYVQRLDDLRMQGAAQELQKRMREIEEQLIAFQRVTGKDALPVNQQDTGSRGENNAASVFAPPQPDGISQQDASAAENAVSSQENGSEAGESRE